MPDVVDTELDEMASSKSDVFTSTCNLLSSCSSGKIEGGTSLSFPDNELEDFSYDGIALSPFPKVRYPGQFHFFISIFMFIAGMPRKVPPSLVCELLEVPLTFTSKERLSLIVSTEEARVSSISELRDGSIAGGIMDERWVASTVG